MAEQILQDCKLIIGGYDISGSTNQLALRHGVEPKDNTTFGQGTRSMAAGLQTIGLGCEGLWAGGVGAVDDVLFGKLGVAGQPVSIGPVDGDDGSLAYLFQALLGSYELGDAVGENLPFSAEAAAGGRSPLVRGLFMHNATRTASGDGTARQLGAVAAGKRLYGALHVLGVDDPADGLTVTVESDATSAFSGAETTRLSFTAASAIGGEWKSVAGAITDTWWRVSWAITGSTPSFPFIVALGIR